MKRLFNFGKFTRIRPARRRRSAYVAAAPAIESLEKRELLSAACSIDLDQESETLTIAGSTNADIATVSSGTQVAVSLKCGSVTVSGSFNPAHFGHIVFWGGNGNDKFTNNTAIGSEAYGDMGKDTLTGGSGSDFLWGGYGLGDDDRLYGKAGSDTLEGGEGKDKLYGGTEDDYLYGDQGNDYLNGEAGNDWLDAGWEAENDSLYGGAGNDTLHGAPGNDKLYGGTGNDKLYGGEGLDSLYGEAGSDFLDDGSGTEYVNKGTDTDVDYNAYVWAVAGATSGDIFQLGSPTCSLLSSIAAAAQSGIDLSSRVNYLGNSMYSVSLFDSTQGVWVSEFVWFDGTTISDDAQPNPGQEGEFWVTITQRAYLQFRGLSSLPSAQWGEWQEVPLATMTGRQSRGYWRSGDQLAGDDLNRISAALNSGQAVVADTPYGTPPTTLLVGGHSYTVVRLEATSEGWFVVVRNPWGRDGGSGSGDVNDGLVRLSWNDFSRSMQHYVIA